MGDAIIKNSSYTLKYRNFTNKEEPQTIANSKPPPRASPSTAATAGFFASEFMKKIAVSDTELMQKIENRNFVLESKFESSRILGQGPPIVLTTRSTDTYGRMKLSLANHLLN